ncbi:hypothetical protein HF521_020018 [Silurus meridionalis]|uniref:Ig-like domain-containing protein n=1 Tax=Silurus meridionalis TaxID=175797 RepID=A0A8T0BIA7_SILME|nr:hypothetical protein HF521_020018 [Silurus meridionalis]
MFSVSVPFLVLISLLPVAHPQGRPPPVLSVSPQNWLTEGDSVTLSCEVTDSSTDWTFSWFWIRYWNNRSSSGTEFGLFVYPLTEFLYFPVVQEKKERY